MAALTLHMISVNERNGIASGAQLVAFGATLARNVLFALYQVVLELVIVMMALRTVDNIRMLRVRKLHQRSLEILDYIGAQLHNIILGERERKRKNDHKQGQSELSKLCGAILE
jgi:hypothetical protein